MNTRARAKLEILFLILLVLASFSFSAPGSIDSIGGTITGLAISLTTSTSTWQGYFGYVDLASFGYNIPEDWFNTTPQSNATNYTSGNVPAQHVGYLFIVNGTDSTLNVGSNLVPGDLADLDALISPTYDYASNIFTTTSEFQLSGENPLTISDVPTSYLFNGSGVSASYFREGFLNDTDTGNLVYIVDLHYQPKPGFNSSQVAYQYIVPNINDGYSVLVYLENTEPTVTLTSPNGGEVWTGTQTITWNANDLDTGLSNLNVTLYYNTNDGVWTYIDSVLGTNSYDWTLPAGLISNVRVNVTVRDDGNLEASDISDSYFTIPSTDTTPPTVTILHPNSTTIYTTQTVALNVTTNENTDTCLFNIGSGNTTMNKISSTSFNYLMNLGSTDQIYPLTVYCNDTIGNVGNSTLTFSVDNIAPTITLNNPINNQNITGTITLTASVTDADVQNVTFEYNNGSWNPIFVNTTPGTQFTYDWDTSALNLQGIAIRATATDDVNWQNSDIKTNIEIDNTAPSQITNLSASIGSNEGEIGLSWTSVGDDAATGTAKSYIIKRSASEITEGTWSSATTISQSIMPKLAGNSETYTVTNLNNATQYYFAIKAVDNLGLQSTISNSPTNSTRSHDLAVTQVYAPASTNINTATDIIAEIENQGNVQESSVVKFYVDNVYQSNQTITNIQPGQKINKTFSWTPVIEGVNKQLKFNITPVSYETDTADNSLTKTINVVAAHDVSVDSFTHDKLGTTVFKYDTVNITGNVTNNGDLAEIVTVRLQNSETLEQNVTINPGQTLPVSFNWNATAEGLMTITASISGTESDYSNNDKSLYMNVYSVANSVNLIWYDPSIYPASSESADFYVNAYIKNLDLTTDFKEIPIKVDINTTSFDVSASRYGGTSKTFGMNVSANTQDYYYWYITNNLASGDYNVSVIAGYGADEKTISRIVNIP